jgi:3-hydroxyisobutyrate dehydrogenase-like beta-hydroxyacid dehydrogenase
MPERARVAFIGLGRMGGRMADHVIAAGHDVRVVDVSPEALEDRVKAGAAAAPNPAEAARDAEFVHVVVVDDAQVREVLAGPEGALRTAPAGCVVSIHSTAELATIEDMAAVASRRRVTVLDAGVSGGERGAIAGTLITMVGGPQDAVDQARPVFGTFSREVIHAGPLGAGMSLKLARNAAGYMMMAAVHEAMSLTQSAGVDLDVLRHVLVASDVQAMTMAPFALGGPDPLSADETAETRTSLEHTNRLAEKDMAQALALATRLHVPTPVLAATEVNFRRVVRLA